ncbi:MAG: hypothetical protein GXY20_05355 [Clostridiales bacterium]|nr:hypothetical protein [Clostridiales bacterium]
MVSGKSGKPERVFWSLEPSGFGASAAMIFFALSAIGILVYRWGFWKGTDTATVWTQVILPWISAALFIILILLAGKKALWMTVIPFAIGCAFFMTKAISDMSTWKAVMSVVVYILALALYFGTLFGYVRTKVPLAALFILEFLYHLLLADIGIGRIKGIYVHRTDLFGWKGWVLETVVLCIIVGMLLLVLSMKKQIKRTAAVPDTIGGSVQ